MGWGFGILKNIKTQNARFQNGLAGIFEDSGFVSIDHFGFDIVVKLENNHVSSC
jgi:hypothetical protein